ncbi:hypothetical protein KM800_14205 [Clostridium tyrobutyricum]|uniref:hypothetical protein n=1 Tax=Clostridium tyrobutyricum TaxID=1519 RepID=UPI001C38FF91|nr:hypothetical protein [Clostridium tyrobutyricum]MBV4420459.1 hypothetical protein [Clostridium tyrobutyricum]
MNDIQSRFLDIMNYNFPKQQNDEAFAICPKTFYSGLSDFEIKSMAQLYAMAYEKAKFKVQNKF